MGGINVFWRGFTIFGSIVFLFTSFFENLPSRCYVLPLTPLPLRKKHFFTFYNITESLHSRCWESLLFEIRISFHALFIFFFVSYLFLFFLYFPLSSFIFESCFWTWIETGFVVSPRAKLHKFENDLSFYSTVMRSNW